jgi:hypothetical protein
VGSPLHHLCVCRRVIPLHSLITADGQEIKSTIVADLEATYLHEGQQVLITLSDVTLVDSYDSLLSMSALTTKSDMLVAFNKDECHLYHESSLVRTVPKQHGLYMLELQAQQPIKPTQVAYSFTDLHSSFGHLSKQSLKCLIEYQCELSTVPIQSADCDVCVQGKLKPQSRKKLRKAKFPLQRLQSDISGPHPATSSGYSYHQVLVDSFSSYISVEPLKVKSTAPDIIKREVQALEKQQIGQSSKSGLMGQLSSIPRCTLTGWQKRGLQSSQVLHTLNLKMDWLSRQSKH